MLADELIDEALRFPREAFAVTQIERRASSDAPQLVAAE